MENSSVEFFVNVEENEDYLSVVPDQFFWGTIDTILEEYSVYSGEFGESRVGFREFKSAIETSLTYEDTVNVIMDRLAYLIESLGYVVIEGVGADDEFSDLYIGNETVSVESATGELIAVDDSNLWVLENATEILLWDLYTGSANFSECNISLVSEDDHFEAYMEEDGSYSYPGFGPWSDDWML
ncbi:MAG: hypothetical protein GY861_21410 [bacterium]|nr:hypothetical protein [bacterium]